MGVMVFGHRGACGYLPENTMPSLELGFELGSDAIEFDVVMTKDGVPVILHDRDLTHTTTIEDFPQWPTEVEKLTLSQVKELRVKERYPEGRRESDAHSGKYEIPTLSEVLNNPVFDGKHLIIEFKYGAYFQSLGLDSIAAVKKELLESNWQQRGMNITIECFEFGFLREAKKAIGPGISYVFLSAPDMLPPGHDHIDDELLEEISNEFDGLSVAIPMILEGDLVSRAKASGLIFFAYTARVETAQGSVDEWFKKLATTGVDGLFADQPDVLIKTVAALA